MESQEDLTWLRTKSFTSLDNALIFMSAWVGMQGVMLIAPFYNSTTKEIITIWQVS